jgi:hypothetical protein
MVALVALASVASACGTEGDSETTAPTVSTSSELLSNVAYPGLTAYSGSAGDATIFGNKAYLAYLTPNLDIGIVVDSDLSSSKQNAIAYTLTGQAVFGPALLALRSTLYLFYVSGSTGSLMMRRSADGRNWDGPYILATYPAQGAWTTPPAAVAWDNNPVVFIGSGSGKSCLYQYNVSGTIANQRSTQNSGGMVCSNARPSATVWQNALYLAWADNGQSGQINFQHWTDANTWSLATPTGKTGIPGLYPVGAGGLEMVYRSSDAHIYRTFSTDGQTFGTSYQDAASTTNHAAVPFSNWNLSSNWTFYLGTGNQLYTVLE